MLSIEDDTILETFEQVEQEDPSPRKIRDDTCTIYASRRLGKPKNGEYGEPILCDFSEARIGTVQRDTGPFVQRHYFRALPRSCLR